ncbi:MAG: hypothetical protein M1834_001487 [Cirrosporium novae-zelandiae]|nr:MAG: hypothetical protein M1834_008607 [Cirrosporium novae-zelandiae]KAI9736021.1 MAG: hypothetical protein M1834_001487 [Cirrosporium novae-zelandiae]
MFNLLVLALFAQGISCSTSGVSLSQGTYFASAAIADLDQFLGIRYAQAPVGDLRLANPVAYNGSSTQQINATSYGPGCSQNASYGIANGLSEDCLFLNIVRPASSSSNVTDLPVMFWVHGGGNVNGQGTFYNGTALVQHSVSIGQPVIYVGINYRLNGFGFMYSSVLKDANVLNLGLKDQYLALSWVHNNIRAFGGNPDKVTLFGESLGAWDCWSQMHYAAVKNESGKLFKGVITESGGPGGVAGTVVNASTGDTKFNGLLETVSCSNTTDQLACLRKVPYSTLNPLLEEYGSTYYEYSSLTIDDDWFDTDLVSLATSGSFAPIPMMHGSNLNEGSEFMSSMFDPPSRSDLYSTIYSYLGTNDSTIINSILDTYENHTWFENGLGYHADLTANASYYIAEAALGDLYMEISRRVVLRTHCTKAPTWGYHFFQRPPAAILNFTYQYGPHTTAYAERAGVHHMTEIAYVFGDVMSVEGWTQGDANVAIYMMSAWISFANHQTPNKHGLSGYPTWDQFETNSRRVMYLQDQGNETLTMMDDSLRLDIYEKYQSAMTKLGLSELP